jgi:phospholipid-transporting ATPase
MKLLNARMRGVHVCNMLGRRVSINWSQHSQHPASVCRYVIGLVVNTGVDSKVMQGSKSPPLKSSSIDKGINYLMAGVMCIQLVLCTFSEALQRLLHEGLVDHFYLHESIGKESPLPNVMIGVLRFVVLLASFVSVSLYVSVDFNRACTKAIVEHDRRFYHFESGTRLRVRTMGLVDELGCISHVFADKTGTLTQNVMQFRKCSINGCSYGHGNTEIGLARLVRLRRSQVRTHSFTGATSLSRGASSTLMDGSEVMSPVSFDGPELFSALRGEAGEVQRTKSKDFLLLLALCHTVVIEQVGDEKKLSASSPDEAALVAAAS